MTVYAITDTKKGEQGLCLLIFILPGLCIYYAETAQLIIHKIKAEN